MTDETEDRSLSDIITQAIRSNLLDTYVSCPGCVEKYDSSTQKADIQPQRKKKYKTGNEVTLPVIPSVPVIWPSTSTSHIHLPMKAGDTGLLVFCDRSIDVWKVNGGVQSPNDPRYHDISDAIFIPGLHDFSNTFKVEDENNIEIKNASGRIYIYPDGKFKIGNGNEELFDLLVDLLDTIINAKTNTLLGPQNFISVPATKWATLKTKLESLKG